MPPSFAAYPRSVVVQPGRGASMEEQLCRKVIRHALELVENQPDMEAALRERLETESEEDLEEGSPASSRAQGLRTLNAMEMRSSDPLKGSTRCSSQDGNRSRWPVA